MNIIENNKTDRWTYQFSAMLLSALGIMSFLLQPVMLGSYAVVHQLGDTQLGMLAGIEILGTTLASLSGLFWINRVNWKKTAIFAIIVVALGYYLAGLCDDYNTLLVLRFSSGFLGHGVLFVLGYTYLGEHSQPERILGFALAVQMVMSSILLMLLPQLQLVWLFEGMMSSMALLSLLALLAVPWFPVGGIKSGNHTLSGVFTGASRPLLILFAIVIFEICLAAVWAFIETMGAHSGITMPEIGKALAIAGPLSATGCLLASVLSIRYGRAMPLVVTLLGIGASLFILGELRDLTSLYIGFFGLSFFWNFGMPYFFGILALLDDSGRLITLVPAAQGIGATVAPVLAGVLLTGNGYYIVNVISIVSAIIAVVAALAVVRILSSDSEKGKNRLNQIG